MTWTENGLTVFLSGEAYQIHTLTLFFGVVFVLLSIITITVFMRPVRDGPGGQACKWRRTRDREYPTLTKWVCGTCGVDAYTADRKCPNECRRHLDPFL